MAKGLQGRVVLALQEHGKGVKQIAQTNHNSTNIDYNTNMLIALTLD